MFAKFTTSPSMYKFYIISEFYFFLAQVNCEERLFKHDAFRSQKIAAFTSQMFLLLPDA